MMATVRELFRVEYGNKLDMNKMTRAKHGDTVAFVGRIGGLNGKSGVAGHVEPIEGLPPYPAGLLTVALGGSRLLSTYVQQLPFYTAQNVAVLSPLKEDMPLLHRLYYAMCIRANAFRYTAFGREANRTLAIIELPAHVPSWVDDAHIPTVEGMSQTVGHPVALAAKTQWKNFGIGQLFTLRKGRRVTKANRGKGDTRFIGASDKNNGITDMCDLEPNFSGHCLTVPYNGSVGFAFYQDRPFFACDDVQILMPKGEVTKWSLLFVATVIRHEKYRYTYGYKWNLARMRQTEIRLPARVDGSPDWQMMSTFMQGLPFSAAISDE